ncbi:MAG: DUF1257 domain-containing protein [Planctomycetes bacterium]|nr:DUF1257 domain-containing protein [Planctomycetota bacterium]
MSHVVTITTEVRDPAAIAAACRRLNQPEPVSGKTTLFSGDVTGVAVRLPDWLYPVVCDPMSGHVHFDNYKGRWGDQKHLDLFLQMYAVEKARLEARRGGNTVTEQQLADGSIKLTIQVAGGAA